MLMVLSCLQSWLVGPIGITNAFEGMNGDMQGMALHV
jgi:cobalamin synthase